MKKFNLFAIIATALVLISSCKEEAAPEDELTGEFSSIFSYLDSKQSTPQTFTISGGSETTITGAKGTVLTFQPNSFVFEDGTPATGFIEITLLEIQTNADMIFNSVFPLSDGNWLNSGGMYYLAAKQAGLNLKLADGAHYEAILPAQAVEAGMGFYSGTETDEGIDWEFIAPYGDSVNLYNFMTYYDISNTYAVLCDSIGWCNCDYFSGDPTVSCTFNLDGPTTLSVFNTVAFAVLDGENAVFPLNSPIADVITQDNLGVVPMHILVISVIDEILYYGVAPLTPEAGGVYNMTLTATTEAELDEIILSLP